MTEFPEVAASRDRLRLQLALATLVSLSVLVWISVGSYRDYKSVEHSLTTELRAQRIGEQMLDLEEVMTMSARMAAASGEAAWEVRYRQAEPQLDDYIAQAREIQPDTALGTAAARIDSANNTLVDMQHRAFDLVKQGRRGEAQKLLASDLHEVQRELYAQGIKEFDALLWQADMDVRQDLVSDTRRDVGTTGAAALLLVLGALFALRAIRRWQAVLVESNLRLNRQSEELQAFNERLDRKVAERTRDLQDAAIASLNMMEDAISEREQAERAHRELDYIASHDPLTGLANRRLFLERVTGWTRVDGGERDRLALFLLDLERFKNINDSLGQPAGDELLRQVARWLERRTGDADRIARVGADLFAMVHPGSAESGVAEMLEATLADLGDQPFALGESVFRIAAKAGAAMFPTDGEDAETLYRHAEAALKKTKAAGERYLFYTQAMTEKVAGKVTMENQLRSALDNDEFVLHYQPKVNLASGRITGVEALLRWQDPRTGLVPPFQFIPILEETGMIHDVGRWAMRKATADYLRWRDTGLAAVRVAVNVSSLQLRSRAFISEIEQTLGVDPHAAEGLELEITESMVMEDIKQSVASLQAIRAMGVSIAIDDFGTGFSSLGYLAKLPIDVLKIDRSFVIEMEAAPHGLSLVQTIINLAKSLELKTVAEGVETEEQARLLRLVRADDMQGYLFSKPVPAQVLEEKFLGRK